jgi:hypothetical protein
VSIKTVDIKTLIPHARNANKGTERGAIQLDKSMKKLGFGRPIVVDKDDTVIAGNHALQAASDAGIKKVILVESTGDAIIVHRRTDMDLDSTSDKRAVELAIADNRVSETNYDLDAAMLKAEIEEGLDVSDYYRQDELQKLMAAEEAEEKAAQQVQDMLIKLPVSPEQYEEFNSLSVKLMDKFSVSDAVAVVLESMRRAA